MMKLILVIIIEVYYLPERRRMLRYSPSGIVTMDYIECRVTITGEKVKIIYQLVLKKMPMDDIKLKDGLIKEFNRWYNVKTDIEIEVVLITKSLPPTKYVKIW